MGSGVVAILRPFNGPSAVCGWARDVNLNFALRTNGKTCDGDEFCGVSLSLQRPFTLPKVLLGLTHVRSKAPDPHMIDLNSLLENPQTFLFDMANGVWVVGSEASCPRPIAQAKLMSLSSGSLKRHLDSPTSRSIVHLQSGRVTTNCFGAVIFLTGLRSSLPFCSQKSP